MGDNTSGVKDGIGWMDSRMEEEDGRMGGVGGRTGGVGWMLDEVGRRIVGMG